jgi:hypothetical protein
MWKESDDHNSAERFPKPTNLYSVQSNYYNSHWTSNYHMFDVADPQVRQLPRFSAMLLARGWSGICHIRSKSTASLDHVPSLS